MNPRHVLLALFAVLLLAFTISASMDVSHFPAETLKDEITNLPDLPENNPHKQFSGYVTIKRGEHKIFYWFILAAENPATAPIAWWTSGGPGCSGLIGKFTEMGPFQPTADGKLRLRDYTWNKKVNIVYVEQPEVGFTQITPIARPDVWTDKEVASRNADFIEGFFKKFPDFVQNPFFITSESMGGHYIPTLSRELIARSSQPGGLPYNYQGSIVGNPLIYMPLRDYGMYKMMIQRHIIPEFPLGSKYLTECQPASSPQPNPPSPRPSVCNKYESQMDQIIHNNVDLYAMSFPICVNSRGQLRYNGGSEYAQYTMEQFGKAQRKYKEYTLLDTLATAQQKYDEYKNKSTTAEPQDTLIIGNNANDTYFPPYYQPCEEDYTTKYLNRADVQEAIHALPPQDGSWRMCRSVNYSDYDMIESMIPVYKENYAKKPNLRTMVFSGSDDTMCSTAEAQASFFNNLTLDQSHVWETVKYNGQLVGYYTSFKETQFVTIHGAGHMAPSTRPAHTAFIFESFVYGKI